MVIQRKFAGIRAKFRCEVSREQLKDEIRRTSISLLLHNAKRTASKFTCRKRKENLSVVFNYSIKSAREIRQFHVTLCRCSALTAEKFSMKRRDTLAKLLFCYHKLIACLLLSLLSRSAFLTLPILCFYSRGQHLCKFIREKEIVYIRKEFNSHRTGLGHKHGRRFIVLGTKKKAVITSCENTQLL